ADLGARTLIAPAELPIGILTSLVGGPFLLWLLWRERRVRGWV
ncbi:MAG: iron chelate uptake ABC transporter family permease subunit, partial [Gammaproteobacteria bacterium]